MESKPIPPNPPRWHPNPDPASIVVPGLDPAAPLLDQIEQMEQLITIKLQVHPHSPFPFYATHSVGPQNIDENFSKIHNILANKILPAVKRYAVGTKPVREAANVRPDASLALSACVKGPFHSFGYPSTRKRPR
jgi:DASH complex subunit ASK1